MGGVCRVLHLVFHLTRFLVAFFLPCMVIAGTAHTREMSADVVRRDAGSLAGD